MPVGGPPEERQQRRQDITETSTHGYKRGHFNMYISLDVNTTKEVQHREGELGRLSSLLGWLRCNVVDVVKNAHRTTQKRNGFVEPEQARSRHLPVSCFEQQVCTSATHPRIRAAPGQVQRAIALGSFLI